MNVRLPCLVFAAMIFAGCESISDATTSVHEKIVAREAPKSRTYPADQRATYDALKTASTQMGYRFVRGGPAQGELEAVSGVGSGDRIGTARQLSLKVKLERALDGGTVVNVRITEILENDSSNRAGQATETPLRDTPQYEVLFERIGQVLGKPATQ